MIGRLNHVAIAVRDIAKASAVYRETLDDPTGLVHVKDILALLQDAPALLVERAEGLARHAPRGFGRTVRVR